MENKIRIINGYRVIYDPTNPQAMQSKNWKGFIYEHIKVAQHCLKRPLAPNEEVHHLDCNRTNNRQENLLILLKSQHIKLHRWLEKHSIQKKPTKISTINGTCKVCSTTLQNTQSMFCSNKCRALACRRAPRPDKKTLQKEIETTSMLALGKKYGVSDNAIRNWIKSYAKEDNLAQLVVEQRDL